MVHLKTLRRFKHVSMCFPSSVHFRKKLTHVIDFVRVSLLFSAALILAFSNLVHAPFHHGASCRNLSTYHSESAGTSVSSSDVLEQGNTCACPLCAGQLSSAEIPNNEALGFICSYIQKIYSSNSAFQLFSYLCKSGRSPPVCHL